MFIELHAIQSFGPSNLNRDDAGHPKEALFGGVRRARISSQAQKRAIRTSDVFKDAIGVAIGIRTKRQVQDIVEALAQDGIDEEWATSQAKQTVDKLYTKKKNESEKKAKSKEKDTAPIYISEQEIQAIVRFLSEAHANDAEPDIQAFCKAQVKLLKQRTAAPDIALFGRMLAGRPEMNIEAACQVAHAISTHEVSIPQSDFYTAVDDLLPAETRGAAMIGETCFNSATYYSHIRIDTEQLVSNLSGPVDLARRTVRGLMLAFALVVPSGKKNSFVNQHRPDFLMAVARPDNDGQSLVNAFEQPVRASNGSGYVKPSIRALNNCWEQTEACFRLSIPVIAVLNPRGYELPSKELADAEVQDLSEWVKAMTDLLGEA